MLEQMQTAVAIIIFAPLLGCLLAGLLGKVIGRRGAHSVTILGVAIAFATSLWVGKHMLLEHAPALNFNAYTWAIGGAYHMHIGFLIDGLTALMLLTVTFVSLLVHIYTIGYMQEDPGYQRFFSYISLFTFAMLMLVTANNFLQLFFGWEGVGLVSYLLIGFWFHKESAIEGSLKAFLVNRVGDFGFVLGIGAVLAFFGSLDYATVFAKANTLVGHNITIIPGHPWHLATVMCLLLFVGAMGKSAQVPLHVWLPESMEGPTPISALIHAATMVTAGIFMVSRLSPLYELSHVALSFILIIGATGALFMGLLGIVQHDIKRVVAYSTLSQLGYMIAGLGASAFAVSMFHLVTHACFKALLFLAAGSVIIGMHHEQDMRKMGGLWRYMPITWITFLVGGLALCGIPPFAGFYSKDMLIEVIQRCTVYGSGYAYWCVLLGAFVTALYTFRSFFLTFHTKPRMDEHTKSHLKESPWVVWLPLVLLAIPSVLLGAIMIKPILFDDPSLLGNSIHVAAKYNFLGQLVPEFHGVTAMALHAPETAAFWFAVGGIVVAFIGYIVQPKLPEVFAKGFGPIYGILVNKYGFDELYEKLFVKGSRGLGSALYRGGDQAVIDKGVVEGSGLMVAAWSRVLRRLQTGMLYHYTMIMVLGLLIFLCWMILA